MFTNETLITALRDLGATGLADRLHAAAVTEALTPLAMFMHADWVVKSVMLGLGLSALAVWVIWAGKLVQLALASSRLARQYRALAASGTLAQDAAGQGELAVMRRAAAAEVALSDGLPAAGIKERVTNDLSRIEAGAARRIQSGIAVIGSVGAIAPFVGLFGTVWGIMNAFVGIAASGTTNLAVVAPGIAEALLATAIGLVAAIPAVLLFNHLSRALSGYRLRLADAAALVERTLSRDLDRRDLVSDAASARDATIPLRLAAE